MAGTVHRGRALGARADRVGAAGFSVRGHRERWGRNLPQPVPAVRRCGTCVGQGIDLGPAALCAGAHHDDAYHGVAMALSSPQRDGPYLLYVAGADGLVCVLRVVADRFVRLVAEVDCAGTKAASLERITGRSTVASVSP